MTEEQTKIVEAYLLEVGESILGEKPEVSPGGHYPVRRSDTPRLKPDREPYKGIVPKYANAQLPAVEYTMTSW